MKQTKISYALLDPAQLSSAIKKEVTISKSGNFMEKSLPRHEYIEHADKNVHYKT